uniref:WD repeat domain 17 n=1 Tax=Astyanax mexicanus TaxID=7994 RepID=A0A8B9GTH9_ASTMX
HRYNEFKLRAIMSEHKKTITAISWCPHNPEVFASASADNLLIIWNVAEQKAVARLDNTKGIPASISWCWNTGDSVAFVSHRGPLYVWAISGPDSGVTVHKEAHSFLSDICLFRWHPIKKGKVVFGHTDGSLSVFQPGSKNQKHVLRPESLEGTDEEDPVTALEWDPLSTDYLLVANMHNGIRLLDSESLSCVTTFSLPSAAASVQCLAWVPTAPGMFITGDSQVGVLRVWNVSRATPLDNFKLKKTGFHALHVLNSPPAKKAVSSISPSKNHYTSSTSEAVPPPTLSQNQAFSLPPGHAVCCFMDGGVGLYDMGAKKWDFLRDLGHVETIFDCKFKPDDPNLLATASFDGTIKVWDINTLTAVYTSPGNEGVVYSLSWAPGDLNCIAGATSRNGAFIWDVKKGKMITRFSEHGKNGIFCIAWSHKDSKRIATCSGDGFCIIRTIDGKVLHKYKHPAAIFCSFFFFVQWEKALSVAPGVSMKYWKKLMQRRADQLMQEGNDDVIPYCIATGDVKKLVNFFTSRGQLKEALLVAQGTVAWFIIMDKFNLFISLYIYRLLHGVCKELAEWYFQDGRAVLAACCHLAVDNTEVLAMASLIRGNELELAVCVGTVLGESAGQATHYVLELLARKYMTTTTWYECPAKHSLISPFNLIYADTLPTLQQCRRMPINIRSYKIDFVFILIEQLSCPDWTVDSVYPILDLLSYIRTDRLILTKCSEDRNELLILCGYIGALLAIGRQYSSIVPALYEYTSQLLKRREVAVPLQIEQLSVELEAWRACTHSLNKGAEETPYTPPMEVQKAEYSRLLSRMREEPLRGLQGPDYVTGSSLPSHSDVQISCFTGLRIQGPVFFLEDGKSSISLNDALMWAKVNPFSPLGTGIRLNPF